MLPSSLSSAINDQSGFFLADTQYIMGNFRYLLPKSEVIGGWKKTKSSAHSKIKYY